MTRNVATLSALFFLAACAAKQAPSAEVTSDVVEPSADATLPITSQTDVPIDKSAPEPISKPEVTDTRSDAPEVEDPKRKPDRVRTPDDPKGSTDPGQRPVPVPSDESDEQ